MCRWMAYSGAPILLEDLLFKPEHSLIDQSMSSRSAETPTNGDGFGVGWYSARPSPGLFRSIRPAWNDFNLRDLAAQIESPLFLAHVRATSHATVQETNCHPFRHGRWLFVHNGEIFGIEKFRKRLVAEVADGLFPEILGTTDSEVMFYLALTFGLEDEPERALSRMAGFVEQSARAAGVEQSLWMTLALSDGERLIAVRYASDGHAPTLYASRDVEDIYRSNPELRGRFAPHTRLVVSEPVGKAKDAWASVPEGMYLEVQRGEISMRPFHPSGARDASPGKDSQ